MNARDRFRVGDKVRANHLAGEKGVAKQGWTGTVAGFGAWPDIMHVRGKHRVRTFWHGFFEPAEGRAR